MKRNKLNSWQYESPSARRLRRMNWAHGIGLATTTAGLFTGFGLAVAQGVGVDPYLAAYTTLALGGCGVFVWGIVALIASEV